MDSVRQFLLRAVPLAALLSPALAGAHEVYVLDPATVEYAMATDSTNPFTAYVGNEYEFFFWGAVTFVVFSTILAASLFRMFERRLDPFFFRIKRFAHPILRLTVGLSLISFGLARSLFGPELSFDELFGPLAPLMGWLFVAGGVLVTVGLYVRSVSALAIAVYAYAILVFGWYVFTYTDHLGALVLLLILGSGSYAIGKRFNLARMPHEARAALHRFSFLAFPLTRILFGFSVMFAAVYAKFIHSELALQVVLQYDLTRYFPFEPMFVVLGAFIIEFIAGAMILVGLEIRWTALFLIFWLTLSLLYFQEAVWPHIILFGLALTFVCHGYDRYTLERGVMKMSRTGAREPIL
jgi:hypothetical protein